MPALEHRGIVDLREPGLLTPDLCTRDLAVEETRLDHAVAGAQERRAEVLR